MRFACILLFLHIGIASLSQKPYTPQPGSKERKEVMDLLRVGFPSDVLFKVNHFLIKNDWACVSVLPLQGNKDYSEPFWSLLRRSQTGKWTGVDWWEGLHFEDEFEAIDTPVQNGRVAKMIVRKYPACPMDIFPK